jgi:hypothetical protein
MCELAQVSRAGFYPSLRAHVAPPSLIMHGRCPQNQRKTKVRISRKP